MATDNDDLPESIWRETVAPSEVYPEGATFYHEIVTTEKAVEYVRKDLVDIAVAAAYEDAAEGGAAAALEMLMRHNPEAGALQRQMVQQNVRTPIRQRAVSRQRDLLAQIRKRERIRARRQLKAEWQALKDAPASEFDARMNALESMLDNTED